MLSNQIMGVDHQYPVAFMDTLELGVRVRGELEAENYCHPEATFPCTPEGAIHKRCYPVALLYPEYQ